MRYFKISCGRDLRYDRRWTFSVHWRPRERPLVGEYPYRRGIEIGWTSPISFYKF